MSALDLVLAMFDAPRFCRGCGKPIEVEQEGFDARTGKPAGRWYWACPELTVDLATNGLIRRVEWRGGGSHDYGTGRPRWHRLAESGSGERG